MEFPHVHSGDGGDWRSPERHDPVGAAGRSGAGEHAPSLSRCQACGYELSGTPVGGVCPECGTGVHTHVGAQDGTGLAIAALVLGVLSLVSGFLALPIGLVAIVLANKARIAVQEGRMPESGLGMANAGRILGWVGVALGVLAALIVLLFFGFLLTGSPFS